MSTYDVGTLNANPSHYQSGNNGQFVDVFKVKIDAGDNSSNLNIAIHSLNGSSNNTPEAKIYRDDNHNGTFDQNDSLYDPRACKTSLSTSTCPLKSPEAKHSLNSKSSRTKPSVLSGWPANSPCWDEA